MLSAAARRFWASTASPDRNKEAPRIPLMNLLFDRTRDLSAQNLVDHVNRKSLERVKEEPRLELPNASQNWAIASSATQTQHERSDSPPIIITAPDVIDFDCLGDGHVCKSASKQDNGASHLKENMEIEASRGSHFKENMEMGQPRDDIETEAIEMGQPKDDIETEAIWIPQKGMLFDSFEMIEHRVIVYAKARGINISRSTHIFKNDKSIELFQKKGAIQRGSRRRTMLGIWLEEASKMPTQAIHQLYCRH
jgi:hypothetical protein